MYLGRPNAMQSMRSPKEKIRMLNGSKLTHWDWDLSVDAGRMQTNSPWLFDSVLSEALRWTNPGLSLSASMLVNCSLSVSSLCIVDCRLNDVHWDDNQSNGQPAPFLFWFIFNLFLIHDKHENRASNTSCQTEPTFVIIWWPCSAACKQFWQPFDYYSSYVKCCKQVQRWRTSVGWLAIRVDLCNNSMVVFFTL